MFGQLGATSLTIQQQLKESMIAALKGLEVDDVPDDMWGIQVLPHGVQCCCKKVIKGYAKNISSAQPFIAHVLNCKVLIDKFPEAGKDACAQRRASSRAACKVKVEKRREKKDGITREEKEHMARRLEAFLNERH
eukprot:Sspe_Gene.20288::Locus_7440_Transcript_1_1_Confidence_1.000_Length_1589::g.20288::m.20288